MTAPWGKYRVTCPACGELTGSRQTKWHEQHGKIGRYPCKCGVTFYVAFPDDGGPHVYHKQAPPKARQLTRLSGATYVAPFDTRWFPETVTPEVTE